MNTMGKEFQGPGNPCRTERKWWLRAAFVPLAAAFLSGAGCPESSDTQSTDQEPIEAPDTILNVQVPDTVVMAAGDLAEVDVDIATNNTRGRELPTGLTYRAALAQSYQKAGAPPFDPVFSFDSSVATQEHPRLARLSIQTPAGSEPGIYRVSVVALSPPLGFVFGPVAYVRIVVIPSGGDIRTDRVLQMAGGRAHTLALLEDGTAWAWGDNQYGQLGDGTLIDRSAPVRVALDVPIAAVAAGSNHSVALTQDGDVYTWGANDRGQLGETRRWATDACPPGYFVVEEHRENFFVPRIVITKAVKRDATCDYRAPTLQASAIAAGADHTLALTANGVMSFGFDNHGQLGEQHKDDGTELVKTVTGLPGRPTTIAAAGDSSFALYANGEVWGWGDNATGQLGIAAGTDVLLPREVAFTGDVQLLAPGSGFVVARRRAEPGFISWGANAWGQLGDGTTSGRDTPMQVATNLPVYQLAAGGNHAIATLQDGRVYAWGNNFRGQLGAATPDTTQTAPIAVPISGMLGVAAGAEHSLTRNESCGTLWSFGQNYWGQLGHVDAADSQQRPLPVYGIGEAAIAAGCEVALRVWQRGDGNVTATGGILGGQGCDEPYCAAPVAVGTSLDVTAVPASGYAFDHWLGDCDGTDARITILVDASKNCIAVYAEAIDTPPTAQLAFSPGAPFVGDTISFDATASTDDSAISLYEWDFDDDGSYESTGATIDHTFTTPGTHRVNLRVTDDSGLTGLASADVDVSVPPIGGGTQPTLTLVFAGGGTGRVNDDQGLLDCTSDCSAIYPAGTTIFLIPTPAAGSVFSHWGTDLGTNPPTSDCDLDLGPESCQITIDGNRTVRVYFE